MIEQSSVTVSAYSMCHIMEPFWASVVHGLPSYCHIWVGAWPLVPLTDPLISSDQPGHFHRCDPSMESTWVAGASAWSLVRVDFGGLVWHCVLVSAHCIKK